MTDLCEILWVYLVYAFPWPGMFVAWAVSDEGLSFLALWLAIGFPVAYILQRCAWRAAFLGWVIIWFMPGTIICGDATLWPWAFTLFAAFQEGGCSTPLSLCITLAGNVLFVLTVNAVVRRFQVRRVEA